MISQELLKRCDGYSIQYDYGHTQDIFTLLIRRSGVLGWFFRHKRMKFYFCRNNGGKPNTYTQSSECVAFKQQLVDYFSSQSQKTETITKE